MVDLHQLAEDLSELTIANISELMEILYKKYEIKLQLYVDEYELRERIRKEKNVV